MLLAQAKALIMNLEDRWATQGVFGTIYDITNSQLVLFLT